MSACRELIKLNQLKILPCTSALAQLTKAMANAVDAFIVEAFIEELRDASAHQPRHFRHLEHDLCVETNRVLAPIENEDVVVASANVRINQLSRCVAIRCLNPA